MVSLPVKPGGLSAIPVWNGAADSNDPTQPTPDSWKTCVAVDSTNSQTGTASINCNGHQVQAEIVPLRAFYSVQINAAEAATINSLKLAGAAAVQAGDFQVLVALHVTTKEITNWTWATFWWQNGENPPNDFPGSVAEMPDASKVKGPWRNYAMCISDSMVVPAPDPKGKPVVCFNPYLETNQTDGLNSNCMSCHAMARLPLAPTANRSDLRARRSGRSDAAGRDEVHRRSDHVHRELDRCRLSGAESHNATRYQTALAPSCVKPR